MFHDGVSRSNYLQSSSALMARREPPSASVSELLNFLVRQWEPESWEASCSQKNISESTTTMRFSNMEEKLGFKMKKLGFKK